MTGFVNLARRPFANTRPVRRVAIAVWLVALGFTAWNAWLYWHSFFGIEGKKEERAKVERQIEAEQQRLAAAEAVLSRMDLHRQNVEATYLNARIHERTFPWSQLFEHLAQVLPKRVRLESLAPQRDDLRTTSAGRRQRRLPDRVYLQMTGAAASDEDLTQFLDAMFKSPWFTDPTLPHEARQNGVISFQLSVAYRPAGRPALERTTLVPVPSVAPVAPPSTAPRKPAPTARAGEDL